LHKEDAVEAVEREIVVAGSPEEAWRAVVELDWLGEEAQVEPVPGGQVSARDRTGFVEEVDPPRRLAFWWGAPDEDATRVEIELEGTDEGTRVRVVESRPLQLLDAYGADLGAVFGAAGPRPGMPEALAIGTR
jgi:uncharacterized protein YndB with AHSA1/START domain